MNEKLHLFGKDPAVLQKSCVCSIYFVNKLYLNPKCRSYLKINAVPIFLMKTNVLLYTLYYITFIKFSNKIFVDLILMLI